VLPTTRVTVRLHNGAACCGADSGDHVVVVDDEHSPASEALDMNRSDLLVLYKLLMKEAVKMPTQNRQDFIRDKVRREFKKNRKLSDAAEIDIQRRLALTCLEAVKVQQEHLNKLFAADISEFISQQKQEKRRRDMEGEIYSEYFGKVN